HAWNRHAAPRYLMSMTRPTNALFARRTSRRSEAGWTADHAFFKSSFSSCIETGSMLKIWGRLSSFNVQKIMWLVGELEIPHEHFSAGGSFGGLDTPEFLVLNPHGRVPVIDDDRTVVW